MKKDLAIIFGLFLLVVGLIVFGQGYTSTSFLTEQPAQGQPVQKQKGRVNVSAGNLNIEATVARTPSDRKKGLSKRDSLPLSEGMLFVFENKGQYGIWMKDMKFAIDIIWVDENKRIVNLVTNVVPEPGKDDEELTIYRPGDDVLYILEINAGLAALNGLQIGDEVKFEL